jgi:hypothetical protein
MDIIRQKRKNSAIFTVKFTKKLGNNVFRFLGKAAAFSMGKIVGMPIRFVDSGGFIFSFRTIEKGC